MAELFWAAEQYQVPEAAGVIGTVKLSIQSTMQQNGWQGVEVGEDVHGFKPGIDLFAAVFFLEISNPLYWQVITVGGGSATSQQAQQEISELKNLISNLHFL